MTLGSCHCGRIVYQFTGKPIHTSVCHCTDCRRCAGAAGVAWLGVAGDSFSVESGEPRVYCSSPDAERYLCGNCGTGLYYRNESDFPGLVDIQVATLDDPEAFPPQLHLQMADALSWEEDLSDLPRFERFPV